MGLLGGIVGGIFGMRSGKQMMGYGSDLYNQGTLLSQQYERPDFNIPEAVKLANQQMQARKYSDMPGYNLAQNQLGEATARGANLIGEMSSGAEGLGAVANLYANQMGEQRNLAIQNAQFKDQAGLDYASSLEGLGDWQQREWQWEKADPYLAAQQKAAMLQQQGLNMQMQGMNTRTSSMQGMFGGLAGGLGAGLSIAGAASGNPWLMGAGAIL